MKVANIIFNLLLTTFLSIELFGEFTTINTIVLITSLVIRLGHNHGFIYFLGGSKLDQEKVSAYWKYSTKVVLVMAVVSFLLFIYSLNFQDRDFPVLVYLLGLSLFLLPIIENFFGIYRIIDKLKSYTFLRNILEPSIKMLLFVGLIYFINDVLALSFAVVASLLISLFMLIYYSRHSVLKTTSHVKIDKKRFVKYSLPLMLSGIINILILRSDILLIDFFLDSESVALYQIALLLANNSVLILTSIESVFSAQIVQLLNENKIKKLQSEFSEITNVSVVFTFAISTVFIIYGDMILMLFGSRYETGFWVLVVLSIGQIINSATGPCGYILAMSGNSTLEFYTNLASLTLKIIAGVVLVGFFQLEGVAISYALALVAVNLFKVFLVKKKLGIHPYNIKQLLNVGILLMFMGVLYITKYTLGDNHISLHILGVITVTSLSLIVIFYKKITLLLTKFNG